MIKPVSQPSTICEEKNFIVVNKPAGWAVHAGGSVNTRETLTAWLLEKYPEIKTVGDDPKTRPGIVHRLDKDTSGVMVVARNKEGFEELKRLFKYRKIQKTYLALVGGRINKKSGVIDLAIGTLKRHGVKRTVREEFGKSMKPALTVFKTLEHFPGATLIEAKPKTGRMHQIRVHLAAMGHPILGDRLYGGAVSKVEGLPRQFLHAKSIAFSYPEGKSFAFEAGLPEDLKAYLSFLRKSR